MAENAWLRRRKTCSSHTAEVTPLCLTLLRKVTFQTWLVMAGELVAWAAAWLNFLGRTLWVVARGWRPCEEAFLKAAVAAGAIVVSRLRKDAALFDVPAMAPRGKRGPGRPRTYGKNKISLAKRAGHRRGWQLVTLVLYGEEVTNRYKTFLATYRPARRLIRVVLVGEERGEWRYFCTKADATDRERDLGGSGRSRQLTILTPSLPVDSRRSSRRVGCCRSCARMVGCNKGMTTAELAPG